MSNTANNVANINTPGYQASTPVFAEAVGAGGVQVDRMATSGTPDLAQEIPNMMLAKHFNQANVVSTKVALGLYEDVLRLGSSTK